MAYWWLFVYSFGSATLLPGGSEVYFLYLLEDYPFILLLVVASMGNLLGGMLSYYLGWLAKWNWLEKWFRIKKTKVESFKERVQKYGAVLALLCWVPVVGDIISVALGVFRAPVWKTAGYMLAGKAARYYFLALFFME